MSIPVKPDAKAASKTHAERSAETRGKIVDAVVSCIAELGLKKTTTNAIAERAGVTWGALQHHFGGLNGCLIAAFDESFGRFVKTVGEPPSPQEKLPKRVEIFIERSWTHYSSAHYLSMFQLLLNDVFEMDDKQWQQSQQNIIHAMDDVWKTFFQDVIPDKDKRRMLARYTHSVLTGLAVSHSYQWGSKQMKDELTLLRISILSQMS